MFLCWVSVAGARGCFYHSVSQQICSKLTLFGNIVEYEVISTLHHLHDFFKLISSCPKRTNYAMDYLIENQFENWRTCIPWDSQRHEPFPWQTFRSVIPGKSMVFTTLMVMHEYRALRQNLLICKTKLQRKFTFTQAQDDRLVDRSLLRFQVLHVYFPEIFSRGRRSVVCRTWFTSPLILQNCQKRAKMITLNASMRILPVVFLRFDIYLSVLRGIHRKRHSSVTWNCCNRDLH